MKLKVAEHFPIYFWAGEATIRMNLLKYDRPINKKAHTEAYQEVGIERLKEMKITTVHAMLNWGFAPEIEKSDWKDFENFTRLCHENGLEVFAYIQSSNLVHKEWFDKHPQSRKWTRCDKEGNYLTYGEFKKRYFCCYAVPEWVEEVKKMVKLALSYKADGIFLDNILSNPHCYCSTCEEEFKKYLIGKGMEPVEARMINEDLNDPCWREWARFRSEVLVNFYEEIRATIDEVNPCIPLTSNTNNIILFNMIVTKGISSGRIFQIQDSSLIENEAFPRLREDFNLI